PTQPSHGARLELEERERRAAGRRRREQVEDRPVRGMAGEELAHRAAEESRRRLTQVVREGGIHVSEAAGRTRAEDELVGELGQVAVGVARGPELAPAAFLVHAMLEGDLEASRSGLGDREAADRAGHGPGHALDGGYATEEGADGAAAGERTAGADR